MGGVQFPWWFGAVCDAATWGRANAFPLFVGMLLGLAARGCA